MAHKHSVYDTDPHFSIDPKTRVITNLSGDSWTLMQHDHNSERVTFELPRYIDQHDMTQCNQVEVHYINIGENGERNADVYKVQDLSVSPDSKDVAICSWLISGNATLYVGALSFSIRFACVTDSEVDYAWNTAIYNNIAVGTTINNAAAIVEEYSDILAQWTGELEQQGQTLTTLTADVKACNTAITNMPNVYANVLLCTKKSDTMVSVDDVAPGSLITDYIRVGPVPEPMTLDLYVVGKNLLQHFNTITSFMNGSTERWGYIIHLPKGKYTMHAKRKVSDRQNDYLYGMVKDKDGTMKYTCHLVKETAETTRNIEIEDGDVIYLYNGLTNQGRDGAVALFDRYNLQIEVGSVATAYEAPKGIKYAKWTVHSTKYPTQFSTHGGIDLSPTVNVFSVPTIPVGLTYHRDTNKAIEKLTQAIISLGGNV